MYEKLGEFRRGDKKINITIPGEFEHKQATAPGYAMWKLRYVFSLLNIKQVSF